MIVSKLNGKRLTLQNLNAYMKEQYSENYTPIAVKTLLVSNYKQSDFETSPNCVLSAISVLCHHYAKIVKLHFIYDLVKDIAKKYAGNNKVVGLIPCFHRTVCEKVLAELGVAQPARSQWFERNFEFYKYLIDTGHPILLTVSTDGRDYYRNHSVVVVGYEVEKAGDHEVPLLIVKDGINKGNSLIDMNITRPLCMVY